MNKYLAAIILSPLIGVLAMLALAEMQFEPSWQKNYVGMTEAEAIGFLGQRDTRDFDGDY